MSDLPRIHEWLQNNAEYVKNMSVDELAELLIAMKFDPDLVKAWKMSEKFRRCAP